MCHSLCIIFQQVLTLATNAMRGKFPIIWSLVQDEVDLLLTCRCVLDLKRLHFAAEQVDAAKRWARICVSSKDDGIVVLQLTDHAMMYRLIKYRQCSFACCLQSCAYASSGPHTCHDLTLLVKCYKKADAADNAESVHYKKTSYHFATTVQLSACPSNLRTRYFQQLSTSCNAANHQQHQACAFMVGNHIASQDCCSSSTEIM